MSNLSTSKVGELKELGMSSDVRDSLVEAIEGTDIPDDAIEGDARFEVRNGREIRLCVSTETKINND